MRGSGAGIHPVDLRRRRERCRAIVQALGDVDREFVRCCNVCQAPDNVIIAVRDRYGLAVRTAMCRACGLVYLVDRFTVAGYNDFYSSGRYRMLLKQYYGAPPGLDYLWNLQRDYADSLIRVLDGYVPSDAGSELLDIGGGAGLVARVSAITFEMTPTVLDPAPDDAQAAAKLGVRD